MSDHWAMSRHPENTITDHHMVEHMTRSQYRTTDGGHRTEPQTAATVPNHRRRPQYRTTDSSHSTEPQTHYSPRTRSGTTKLVTFLFSDLSEAFTIGTEFIRDAESSISFYFPLAYLGINLR